MPGCMASLPDSVQHLLTGRVGLEHGHFIMREPIPSVNAQTDI